MADIIKTPDLGIDKAEVIELLVSSGEHISEGQSIVLVESDKVSMEIPSPSAGVLTNLAVKVGDTVSEGVVLGTLEALTEDSSPTEGTTEPPTTDITEQDQEDRSLHQVLVPDLGVDSAKVIEILAHAGEHVETEQGLLLLESDKASMELPAPFAGTLVEFRVEQGDDIRQGMVIALVQTTDVPATVSPASGQQTSEPVCEQVQVATRQTAAESQVPQAMEHSPASDKPVYAGPGVRKLARELGVDLSRIQGSGPSSRILKEDVHQYVKQAIQTTSAGTVRAGSQTLDAGTDFAQFGAIETKPMTTLHQLTADAMVRSWQAVPRVTQFDQADITELEEFRTQTNNLPENEKHGVRLTLLAFLVYASVKALKRFPQCNVSVDGYRIIQKQYYNIGIAVDTPAGLVVPVIQQADSKSVVDIATEIRQLADQARTKTLKPTAMRGGCFSISSLGGIGGTGFTPVVNHPEVAIMGVANSSIQPVWNGTEFVPRRMCPLSLSYDHRAVNGADAARFLNYIARSVSDIRSLLL